MSEYVDLGLPQHMDITHDYESMTIIRKWFGVKVIFITAFAVIWNSFILSNFIDYESTNNYPWIHILVGIGMSYYALLGWVNKTYIRVTRQQIQVKHSPFPWIGNKVLNSSNIKQLYGKENISSGQNGSSVSYEVHVIANSGKDTALLKGLGSSEQALYIEQEIEKYLGIKNQPVRGELG